ncbi:hypothetical protein LTR91_022820 [Friedmanniomyces endolithicus]|uniref:AB hydrolase-1 domain-containing protein n=1 Tax=Friedmanniomyces endolithicus TaxID=329885 RepID=A0AAN6H462_9PEZI|nr:hypothetical protein LTR94_015841 [Friedmanniomyces endolithicus]KAK0776593.1 hypothetical protein LTR59_014135 [Friedmanniomyces endolithicus]KAK0778457.1 hypothetical protein LTR75_015637 [Friedmanniomyces endolithicus]KAK0782237.1 hypothetical protein LTR38_013464 [Friedmanniomyces endolithicus]KAK0869868.1 hypothetical protein LTR87_013526 [Friedmanniomyces endolithicus]
MKSVLSFLALAALCQGQIDISCSPSNLSCLENRTKVDQALLEIPNSVTFPIQNDAFYDTPANFTQAKPGQIVKLEPQTNVTAYDVPPGTSLSRFMYASVDEKNQTVPATGIILWPFTPKTFPYNPLGTAGETKYPLVAWAHGTSGVVRQCAVSNLRNLQYDFRSVFTLANLGYAVVIADYAGLGTDVPFNYLAYKLHANDVVYGVSAAQSVFPELSTDWVSFGHSEGGGVAWAIAERQAISPIPGFLGTIAAAPPPFPIATTSTVSNSVFQAFLSFTIARLYGLDLAAIFRPIPLQALQYVESIGGCNDAGYAAFATFNATDIYSNTSWPMSQPAVDFAADYSVSGKPLGGPLLIVQGSADTVVGTVGAMVGYNATCALPANAQVSVQYVSVNNQDHNPSLYASQRLWLQWIEDRFNRFPLQEGCSMVNESSARPGASVQTAERFLVEYTKPWVTIFTSTFLPSWLWKLDLGYAQGTS